MIIGRFFIMANDQKFKLSAAEKKRRENVEAQKRTEEKKKRRIKIAVLIIAAVLLATGLTLTLIFTLAPLSPEGKYVNESQSITLNEDGTFSATLAHESKSGTYKVKGAAITFTVGGTDYKGSISSKKITIPSEWNDEHDHGSVFTKT